MTLRVLVSSLLPGNTIAVAELGEKVEVDLPGGSGHERRLLPELLLEARLRRHLTPLEQQQRRRPECECSREALRGALLAVERQAHNSVDARPC